jgi:hypothetical protein
MTAGLSASTAASGDLVTSFWRLPDKQKNELTVFKARTRASSTAFSIADYVRKEIWSARIPVFNMAEGIDEPVRRDLHVPSTFTIRRTAAYTRAFHRIAAGRQMGDGVSGGFACGVKRVSSVRRIRHIESVRCLVGPDIAQCCRPSWLSQRRRRPKEASKS